MVEKFRTSIHTPLKKKTLFRGSFLAGIGIFFLIYGGVFLDVSQLNSWGWIIYAVGIGLIAYGLIPYRKLCALENSPNELVIEDNTLSYFSKKKPVFSLACSDINEFNYIDSQTPYGIAILLNQPMENKIIIYNQKAANTVFSGVPILFLPYFSKRTCERLNQIIH
jgi:hypothetical protein